MEGIGLTATPGTKGSVNLAETPSVGEDSMHPANNCVRHAAKLTRKLQTEAGLGGDQPRNVVIVSRQ